MRIFKKQTTLENLTFNIYLTQDIKNLGFCVDLSEDMTTSLVTEKVIYVGEDKLNTVRSFDYNTPYIEGVNGVTLVNNEEVQYMIDGVSYVTNKETKKTNKVITYNENMFSKNNFIRTDDTLGLIEKPIYENLEIERGETGIIESFGKLQQVRNVDEFENFGNEFYDIFDQTF